MEGSDPTPQGRFEVSQESSASMHRDGVEANTTGARAGVAADLLVSATVLPGLKSKVSHPDIAPAVSQRAHSRP